MDYKYLDSSIDLGNLKLHDSDCINEFLLKNNNTEILKAIDFLNNDSKFLYIHGFLGTGKRQFINYVCEYLDKDVIKLEYYCKSSTVCDDVLLSFINTIEKNSMSKVVNLNAKVTTLQVKLNQYISAIKKPFIIIIHSFDDIADENRKHIVDFFEQTLQFDNVKFITSTRAMITNDFNNIKTDKKIFLKALNKELFKEFTNSFNIKYTENALDNFYKYSRGYYYYTALTLKIIQAMKISLNDFLSKFTNSGMNFDSYLGITYINLIPSTIRNFFWFLRTMRHGISLNALATLELYDEFSIEYLKNNLMIFQAGENIYVQDYFQQNIDISIPQKTEIKLHKYIISIYEGQLKEPLQTREITISRQAMRAEIEYHNKKIQELKNNKAEKQTQDNTISTKKEEAKHPELPQSLEEKLKQAHLLAEEKRNTDAITLYLEIADSNKINTHTLTNIRLELARLYKRIENYTNSQHYYELVENFYKKNKEVINLNYLNYELTELYFAMYKINKAIDTIKKVIYSVDTPQSLLVAACTLLGNIYSETNSAQEAYNYYQKALESIDEHTDDKTKAELYFKFALANDDRHNEKGAFEFYSKCISISENTPYKALSLSNMGSCYLENENYSDAKDCFKKAYEIEKANNNYDGIYYNALNLAKILQQEQNPDTLNFLLEAKQSAEFINEDFYILEATLALGDYYYNNASFYKKALTEYFKAKKIAQTLNDSSNIIKIDARIKDMELRMNPTEFGEIKNKYE